MRPNRFLVFVYWLALMPIVLVRPQTNRNQSRLHWKVAAAGNRSDHGAGVASSSSLSEKPRYIRTQPFTLVTYNAFFLPRVARVVSVGWATLESDAERADWIGSKLVEVNPDFICLMETFNHVARGILVKRLRAANFHVLEELNAEGWISTNAGLTFASRYPVVSWAFEEFEEATMMTSEMMARKGVGFALVNATQPNCTEPAYVCIFLTHVQAEVEGRHTRRMQFLHIQRFVRARVRSIRPARCVVLLAGDFNVNGLLADDSEEYEGMLQALGHPTDLYRMLRPLEIRSEAVTWESQRLDYIFSYPPRIELLTGALEVLNCSVLRGWKLPHGEPASDHHPVALKFQIPVFPDRIHGVGASAPSSAGLNG
eukprot:NODE_1967_length_1341_cov_31.861455_g1784_i0.p1 GENE.NODE_1967_length_1341_cov_31.861455_g1784_i0~~NODE_1967_length_1341_cov_31.861455_g1784_i0.p1  ORF type:complete len:370 (+),score=55.39 NODE_1967_length_1341_cov_31.861455_g1784_i0:58-1167(+)